MWDTVNMQTQKVSKVPPFDGILYAIGCSYNSVPYKMISHTVLWWLWQDMNQSLLCRIYSITWCHRWTGLFIVRIWEKTDLCYNSAILNTCAEFSMRSMVVQQIIMISSNENIFCIMALCEGNPPVIGGFPSQRASNMDLRCSIVVSLSKRLDKHSIDQRFEMPWWSFVVTVMYDLIWAPPPTANCVPALL